MLAERKLKSKTRETFTHNGTEYLVRSRDCLTFTTYRIGGQWEEPTGKRGMRKEAEYKRKCYACVHVASVHTNAVTVAYNEQGKRKFVTLVNVTVTGEPDAVREYLDAVGTLSLAVATETGFRWELML